MDSPLLTVRDLAIRFGGVAALDGLSFDAGRAEILGIIGPNGAGKSTLLNCLSGLSRPLRGEILLEGRNLFRRAAHRIARLGVGRTYQHLALFESMTVRDNVRVGAHALGRGEHIDKILDRLKLSAVADRGVADIPYNLQRCTEIARALAAKPRLLLFDEPAAGLSSAGIVDLANLVRDLRDRDGMTILLVEHRMNFLMPLADRILAMDFGRALALGTPDAVRNDPAVIRAYLGQAA